MGRKKPNFDNWALEEWIFSHEKLTALEKLVALAIFQHRNHQSGNCHPSSPVLAKRTSLSKTTVLKYVERLESKNVQTVDRRGGRGGNWYYSLFDDERAEQFRNSKPAIECHQVEEPTKPKKENKMPQTTKIDPALVGLVAEIKERGITKSSDVRPELIEAINTIKENMSKEWGTPGIARRLNKAGIPRLRGEGLWRDPDVHQLLNPKKPTKSSPKKAPAPVKHKCDGCAKYDARPDGEDFCKESGWLVRGLAGCPRGKWEEGGGPF